MKNAANNAALRKAIGKSLQAKRKAGGYKSARAFAEDIGMEAGTYTAYEQGSNPFSIEQAWNFAEKLGCSIDELCGRPKSPRLYDDPGQEAVNRCYENMNDKGRTTLESVARSMERDASNRISKNGAEAVGGAEAMGA